MDQKPKRKVRIEAPEPLAEGLSVIATRPVTLYEDAAVFVFYATQKDVDQGKVFIVPDNLWWKHKIFHEKILALAPVVEPKQAIKEQEDNE